jgi:hypothetical protein
MKKIVLIFLISFFVFQNIPAQSKLSLSVGGGYVCPPVNSTRFYYWSDGYSFNISLNYKIASELSAFINTSYQQHYFNENRLEIVTPAVLGYDYDVNGTNSSIIDLSVGTKFYFSKNLIKPFIGLGGGLLFINLGKVELIQWMDGDSNKTTNKYSNTDFNYNIGQINFSLGTEIELFKELSFVLEAKVVKGFNGPSYYPLNAAIKFVL